MIDQPKKPHWSNSQLELLFKCGEAYRRRYIEGEIIPPAIAMLKGTALDGGASHNFRQKIDSHEDLPVAQIVDAAVAKFETEGDKGYLLSAEEKSVGAKKVLGQAIDDVAELATCHAKTQAPDYQPTMVQRTIRAELPGPRDLVGVLDLADDQGRVIDLKTTKRSKTQDEADTTPQLTIYDALHKAATGQPASEVRLDVLVQTKTQTKRQVLVSSRDEHDFHVLANRINAATQQVDAGIFQPAPLGAWWCSGKWCGYAATCPFYNAQRKEMAGE